MVLLVNILSHMCLSFNNFLFIIIIFFWGGGVPGYSGGLSGEWVVIPSTAMKLEWKSLYTALHIFYAWSYVYFVVWQQLSR